MADVLAFSAHLDDAVWSCCGPLATADRAVVVTVFAGEPNGTNRPSELDRRAGFRTSREALAARRREDRDAAELVGFKSVHLDLVDAAYRAGEYSVDVVESEVRRCLSMSPAGVIIGPLGVKHPDHELLGAAFRRAVKGRPAWLYEDLPYSVLHPTELERALIAAGLKDSHDSKVALSPEVKRNAVHCYRSQVSEATHLDEILGVERVHPFR